jgi:hypothetical protein
VPVRESDLKYRLAFDTMPDGYVTPCRADAPGAYRKAPEE